MHFVGALGGAARNRGVEGDEPSPAPGGECEQVDLGELARPWMRPGSATRMSSRLTSSGQNSWIVVAQASRRRSATAAIASGFGYPGCDMIRRQPFWVIGHDAQPSRAWAENHCLARAWSAWSASSSAACR